MLLYVAAHLCVVLLCGSFAAIEEFHVALGDANLRCLGNIVRWTSFELLVGPPISVLLVVLVRRGAYMLRVVAVMDVVLSFSHWVVIIPLIS